MSREVLSRKLVRQNYGELVCYEHWCPGCEVMHPIASDGTRFRNGASWTFNGNAERPTFSPSVNVGPGTPLQCHYFIREGQIQFCGDSQHALKGQTVNLPDIPDDWLE